MYNFIWQILGFDQSRLLISPMQLQLSSYKHEIHALAAPLSRKFEEPVLKAYLTEPSCPSSHQHRPLLFYFRAYFHSGRPITFATYPSLQKRIPVFSWCWLSEMSILETRLTFACKLYISPWHLLKILCVRVPVLIWIDIPRTAPQPAATLSNPNAATSTRSGKLLKMCCTEIFSSQVLRISSEFLHLLGQQLNEGFELFTILDRLRHMNARQFVNSNDIQAGNLHYIETNAKH
ncbi:hypothetical protein Ancab_005118 [Ancistrocladus abbreviatus]